MRNQKKKIHLIWAWWCAAFTWVARISTTGGRRSTTTQSVPYKPPSYHPVPYKPPSYLQKPPSTLPTYYKPPSHLQTLTTVSSDLLLLNHHTSYTFSCQRKILTYILGNLGLSKFWWESNQLPRPLPRFFAWLFSFLLRCVMTRGGCLPDFFAGRGDRATLHGCWRP